MAEYDRNGLRGGRKEAVLKKLRSEREKLARVNQKLKEARLRARLQVLDRDDGDSRVLNRLMRKGSFSGLGSLGADEEDSYDAGYINGFDDAGDRLSSKRRSRAFYSRFGWYPDSCSDDPCKKECPSPADILKARLFCKAPEILYGANGDKIASLCGGKKKKTKKAGGKKAKKAGGKKVKTAAEKKKAAARAAAARKHASLKKKKASAAKAMARKRASQKKKKKSSPGRKKSSGKGRKTSVKKGKKKGPARQVSGRGRR